MTRRLAQPRWPSLNTACSNGQLLRSTEMEDALYEIDSNRRFTSFGSVTDALPDETTILNFWRLLEKHKLNDMLLSTVNQHLQKQSLLVPKGTLVDATIIHAASSTKNRHKTSNPAVRQTKKGNTWYFGMKTHVGADVNSGAVHSVTVTPEHFHRCRLHPAMNASAAPGI